MSALTGTSLEFVLRTFGVSTDEELITRMTWIGFWYTVAVGLYTYFFPAPYGKFSNSQFVPTINAKFGWMIQESPVVFVAIFALLLTPARFASNPGNIIPVLLMVAHYVNRSFIFTLRLSSTAKPAPLATVISAFIFCLFNGLLQSHHLLNVFKNSYGISMIFGTVLFVLGMGINIHHDNILSSLRGKSKEKGRKSSYQIPSGGLFSLVSSANYFGEILEWWGFALMTLQYPQIIFAVFTTVFLGIRGTHHHKFYKEQFSDSYPKTRKAVIPFLV